MSMDKLSIAANLTKTFQASGISQNAVKDIFTPLEAKGSALFAQAEALTSKFSPAESGLTLANLAEAKPGAIATPPAA